MGEFAILKMRHSKNNHHEIADYNSAKCETLVTELPKLYCTVLHLARGHYLHDGGNMERSQGLSMRPFSAIRMALSRSKLPLQK
jgi:hypothetical protein